MYYSKGFLRRSSSGKFVGVLKYRDPEGSWRQITKTFTSDRGESEDMLASWRSTMEVAAIPSSLSSHDYRIGMRAASSARGVCLDEIAPTVEEAVRACLSAQLARGAIERSTHDTQLSYAQRDLFPILGQLPLNHLTTEIAQMWIDSLCSRVSPSSARIPYSTLNKTCALAVRRGILPVNPIVATDSPQRSYPERSFLLPSTVSHLECAITREWGDDNPLSLAVRLGLYAGLRAGEVCGLRWCDVSEDGSSIRVSSSIGRSIEGCYVKAPKNRSSIRDMPIVSVLARQLRERSAYVANGFEPSGTWFVCGEEESFLDPRRLSNKFAELCEAENIVNDKGQRATFHVLRHTYATAAVRAGIDVRTLADLLGHSRADMTLNVYAASNEEAKRIATKRLDEFFRS